MLARAFDASLEADADTIDSLIEVTSGGAHCLAARCRHEGELAGHISI